jgi:hypothetical protein
MKIRTIDGETIEGATPEDVLAQMHKMSWTKEADDRAYAHATARRAAQQSGKPIRAEPASGLLSDLADAGLIMIEEG